MRTHDQDLRPNRKRGMVSGRAEDERPDSAQLKAVAAGSSEVLTPSGLLGMQRAAGNAAATIAARGAQRAPAGKPPPGSAKQAQEPTYHLLGIMGKDLSVAYNATVQDLEGTSESVAITGDNMKVRWPRASRGPIDRHWEEMAEG